MVATRFPARLVGVLALCAAARGGVLTVGPGGSDYTQIQPAVTAALDGDVVLVRAGAYAQFAIDDKSLSVVAAAPGTVHVLGQVRVQDLAAHRRVALIDLSVTGQGENALLLWGNQGSVRVRGGTWRGTDDLDWLEWRNAAIEATDCQDIALRECVLVGGRGVDAKLSPWVMGPGSGGDAIRATNCRLALFHCTLSGGDGGSDGIEEGYNGGGGGDGLHLAGGFLFSANCSFSGGDGGQGGEEDGIPPFWNEAGHGGPGGHGLRLDGLAVAVQAELLASPASGGAGGAGGPGYWGPNGSPGAPGLSVALLGSASATTVPHAPRRLIAPGLWHGASPVSLEVRGVPGELVLLAVSPKAGFKPQPDRKGVALLGGIPTLRIVGQLDASGSLQRTFAPADPPGGREGLTFELQAVLVNPLTGAHLSGPSTTVLVDSTF